MKKTIFTTLLSVAASTVLHAATPIITNPENLNWVAATDLPAGAQVAVLAGDPAKHEPFVAPVNCEPNPHMPAIYDLPAFVLTWLRPMLEKSFFSAAFDSHADTKLITEEKMAGRNNPMYVIKAMIRSMAAIPACDITTLQTPTLIFLGETDHIIPAASTRNFYHHLPQHQFQIIEQAAHMLMLEQPEKINAMIARFII